MNFTAKLGLCNALVTIATLQLIIAKHLIDTFDWNGVILISAMYILGLLVFLFNGNEK